MAHFYLTLPSNSSEKFYPQNTLAQFTTKLHEEVTLEGDWEVGLSEIIYPKTWYNISRNERLIIECKECSDVTPDFTSRPMKRPYSKAVHITAGYYKSMSALVDEINGMIEQAYSDPIDTWKEGSTAHYVKQTAWPTFTYNSINDKVYVMLHGKTSIKFSRELRHILGLDTNTLENHRKRSKVFRADRTSDLELGRHALYIYCDLLECVPIGDTAAPLLRIIDTQGDGGAMIQRSFEKPRYVPLQKKHFGSLEIHIRDSHGEKIPFESGTVIVTLHFRRR